MKKLPLISSIILVGVFALFLFQWDATAAMDPEPEPAVEKPATAEEETDEKKENEKTEPLQPAPPAHNHYTQGKKTRDGIGKYYQGREIAYVMGHPAIKWLERTNREAEEAPTKAINLLELGKNDIIADIGAGSGYYSLRIAIKQPKGKVVAVDIQQEMVDFLKKRAENLDLTNVSTHLGKIDGIGLPAESINAALMVDAYHEFSHPFEMMTSIVTALKPGGKVFLLEYRAEDPNVPIKPLHKMTQAQAKKEMALVGLEWVKTVDDLPWQHFMVFRKP